MNQNLEFISRFVEACGTAEPAKIARLLDISYQSAKNYLQGRLPQADILILIANRTECSIDWLLTGEKKFVKGLQSNGTPLLTGQLKESVREICVEVINEMNGSPRVAQPKVVKLQSSDLLSEKAGDNAKTLSHSYFNGSPDSGFRD